MVIVQRRYTTVDDGMGGEAKSWTNHLTDLDGTLDRLNGDEILASEKIQKTSTHIFIVFDVLDIAETDRFKIDGYIYNIKDVDNPMNMDRQLEIMLEYTGLTENG